MERLGKLLVAQKDDLFELEKLVYYKLGKKREVRVDIIAWAALQYAVD